MADAKQPRKHSPARLRVTVHDDNTVTIWTREGMPVAQLAKTLHEVADTFASGDVERID